jgi:iron(III) transport system ATP-binding protein
VSVRPEAIALGAEDSSPLRGSVAKAAYLGNVMEYTIDTPAGELFCVSGAVDAPLAPGARVGARFAAHGVAVIATQGIEQNT